MLKTFPYALKKRIGMAVQIKGYLILRDVEMVNDNVDCITIIRSVWYIRCEVNNTEGCHFFTAYGWFWNSWYVVGCHMFLQVLKRNCICRVRLNSVLSFTPAFGCGQKQHTGLWLLIWCTTAIFNSSGNLGNENIFPKQIQRCIFLPVFFFILRIHLIPGFIDSEQADWMFEQLLQDIPWGQRTHIRQGKECVEHLFRSFTGQFHNRICVLFRIAFHFWYYHFFKFPCGFPCISEDSCSLLFNL